MDDKDAGLVTQSYESLSGAFSHGNCSSKFAFFLRVKLRRVLIVFAVGCRLLRTYLSTKIFGRFLRRCVSSFLSRFEFKIYEICRDSHEKH